mgnify:CR=1 FL=1
MDKGLTDLKKQKDKLKGNSRHDLEETRKYQIMKLSIEYNIEINEDTLISTKTYNDICGHQKKTRRLESGRGKYSKKQKRALGSR